MSVTRLALVVFLVAASAFAQCAPPPVKFLNALSDGVTACVNPLPGGSLAFLGGGFFGPAGGSGALAVAPPESCNWTPAASSWISLSSATPFMGNHTVGFGLARNAGALPRIGFIAAALQAMPVLQAGTDTSSPFADVSPASPYADYIRLMQARGLTQGCSPGRYCPETALTRGQAVVFVIRAMLGEAFPYSSAAFFTDVPFGHPYFRYIQKAREIGLTAGCSAGPARFCPDEKVTRGQMAVFLIRALPATPDVITLPYFSDVEAAHPYFRYIQKMKQMGLTAGCAPAAYCPEGEVPRQHAAVFLMRAFAQTP